MFVSLAALADAGVELDKFTVITGALGVGIGFGLQNIVNNFVSGLILLFERPINIDDTVEVERSSRYGLADWNSVKHHCDLPGSGSDRAQQHSDFKSGYQLDPVDTGAARRDTGWSGLRNRS